MFGLRALIVRSAYLGSSPGGYPTHMCFFSCLLLRSHLSSSPTKPTSIYFPTHSKQCNVDFASSLASLLFDSTTYLHIHQSLLRVQLRPSILCHIQCAVHFQIDRVLEKQRKPIPRTVKDFPHILLLTILCPFCFRRQVTLSHTHTNTPTYCCRFER